MTTNGAKPISQEQNLQNKLRVQEIMLDICQSSIANIGEVIAGGYGSGAGWRGSHPINEISDTNAIAEQAWVPLKQALPDVERRDEILVGGRYTNGVGETKDLVACMGHYCGTFKTNWLDIPATGQPIWLRYGEVHELHNGKIVQSSCLWDILDFIRQAGIWPIAPSWGAEGRWAGPITCDGLVLAKQDMEEGLGSIAQTLAMHKTLANYNDAANQGREGLLNMPQKEFWHEKMMWYGPSGIGTTRGLAGFVDFHQLPFRLTWPGRKGGQTLINEGRRADAGHYIQIGDGPYSVTGGWPSVIAHHSGGDVFGVGATGKEIEMRVMDFYLHHEGKIRENWVPIDVIHILHQMGVDVMGRVKHQFGPSRLGLTD